MARGRRAIYNAEPHSPIWFVIVDRLARRFGQQVRFTLQCEGSHSICTICGDQPIGDFQIVEAVTTPRGVPSLRLCTACLIARECDGEMLLPMNTKPENAAARVARAGRASFVALWKRIYLPKR
ncbi:hypothetical protein ATE68_01455 [Sphingopyxis sp. H038]|nr:hypothetical protein ATE78_01455 [Sphingopyxis sp. H012]KTE13455.1 hypothetical protein ATE70_01970 [Sphingopyxis sp. H053]KTE36834.1 hypothetical protein ATE68_01455 [Sphingopyxis sp. H038]KTE47127.1 hypothetical protein ATE77_01970 [Sphingopyxis sp. H005]KTE48358.1 hypothetical protein ATE73_03850 [Sphingopyxis sp. H077]KTE71547.1 hypothetical protein ATE74_01970 [Sphingopyxis sp. H085]